MRIVKEISYRNVAKEKCQMWYILFRSVAINKIVYHFIQGQYLMRCACASKWNIKAYFETESSYFSVNWTFVLIFIPSDEWDVVASLLRSFNWNFFLFNLNIFNKMTFKTVMHRCSCHFLIFADTELMF